MTDTGIVYLNGRLCMSFFNERDLTTTKVCRLRVDEGSDGAMVMNMGAVVPLLLKS